MKSMMRTLATAAVAAPLLLAATAPRDADWQLVFDQNGNKMWVDANSIQKNGSKRIFRTRMTLASQPQFTAYMTNDADCAARKSHVTHMDVEEGGKIVNSADENGEETDLALEPLVAIICK